MADNSFIDTGILVHCYDKSNPLKQKKAYIILEDLWIERKGRISIQVMNEFYDTVTRKLKPGMAKGDAWKIVETLFSWDPAAVDNKTIIKAYECESQYRLSWRDCLIISSAWLQDCKYIISDNLRHGQSYFSVEVKNPYHEIGGKK